jgi:multidrug efflux system membrane fusion protein
VVDSGKVVVINNQVDQTTGTVQLKGEFPNANVQLWPGQFVNIRVLINTLRQVVVVPTAAVQRGPDGTFVYVVKDDNTVSVRPVTVRQQDDLQAVIATGLMAAERVVTTGFGRLADGTKVEATSAEDAGQVSTDPSQRPARPAGGAPKGKGQGQGQGQRQQGAANVPGAVAPGTGAPGTDAAVGNAAGANPPSPAATDPPQPAQRRSSAPKGPEQPAASPGGSPSTAP